ncbi:HypC/HybG/HupF family hydrogenase formation chaperone [Acidimangrovimonas sediminis]|uniref:HypC/HybG/HupF family hydrogenase formation chaperone n=1 Tax=Acidimangrovimonas sediminis TaxID=2056283 RepID=UPI000C809497|nr:HypC/HybG/HupF family hydrogenase formation chaperone [Acidimangrovimonas sediminis]
MCIAIPMQIRAIDGLCARCEMRGVFRDVSLFMVQDEEVVPGDFVLVHLGHAVRKIPADEARLSWDLLQAVAAAQDGAAAGRA